MTKKFLSLIIIPSFFIGAFFIATESAAAPPRLGEILDQISQQIQELQSKVDSISVKVDGLANDLVNPNQITHWRGFPYREIIRTTRSPNGDPNGLERVFTTISIFNPGTDPVDVTVKVFDSFGDLLNDPVFFSMPGKYYSGVPGLFLNTCQPPDPESGDRSCIGYAEITASGPVIPTGKVRGEIILPSSAGGLTNVTKAGDAHHMTWIPVDQ